MNDEEAIKKLKQMISLNQFIIIHQPTDTKGNKDLNDEIKAMNYVLNLIIKQKAEIEKKDKIIAEIIEEYEYNVRINFKNFCEDELRKDKCIQDCRNCAIKYFENKVKESK